jgi:hypothetical protein
MKIINKTNYYLCELKKKKDFSKLIDFLNLSQANLSVIINLLDWSYNPIDVYQSLLPFHFIWQKTNKSFILVSNMKTKDFQELIIINSLEEALDYFHMEELTRNI